MISLDGSSAASHFFLQIPIPLIHVLLFNIGTDWVFFLLIFVLLHLFIPCFNYDTHSLSKP